MVKSPSCCPWGPRPSRPSGLWCQPSPSRRAGRSGSSQTRLPNQERHHLHLLDGVIGSQSDAALRVGLAAIVGLVQRLAGLSAADLRWRQCTRPSLASVQANFGSISAGGPGWHQCRWTWLASVQMDLAGISAGKQGQRPHGPVPVVIITSGCAREPHCIFWGRLRKQAPCSVQCIIKHLSIVNGWPVDPPKAKPFRCALEIADRTRTQANGLRSPNATHSKLNKALG